MRSPETALRRIAILSVIWIPFLGTVIALVLAWNRAVTWTDLALLVFLFVLTAPGITIGFHRMLTHRAFETSKLLRFVLLALGSMTLEGDPVTWASNHIRHHAHADREGDPHSPVHGLFHAHVGWMMGSYYADLERYGRWLKDDPIAVFVGRTFPFWVVLSLAIPFAIGGWTGLVWGGLVRIFLTHHVTWSVNSVCHIFGSRRFETRDRSRNHLIVAMLAFGEGWHNNHHAFPKSAFHGLRGREIDLSGYAISALERLGLVWDVQRVLPEVLASRSGRNRGVASPSPSG